MGKGSNSTGLRRYNKRVVLTSLRRMGSASKSDLARRSSLTAQAVTRIVDELETTGLIVREGRRLGGKGQPSTLYAINPEGAYSIGVKVGRIDIELLLMDFGGNVLGQIRHEFTVPEPGPLLEKIDDGITALTDKLSNTAQRKLMGVGVAMPWFIGNWTKELEMEEVLARQWQEINFGEEVAKRTHFPVFFENDCSAATIAELQFGNDLQEPNFLYVFIGTFVGGGLVLNGNLETGVHGNAGALASMPVPTSSLSSTPAHSGPFEILLNRASLFGLLRHLNSNGITIKNTSDLPTVMDSARSLIQEWLDDCADALVYAVLSAVGVLDLNAVIIDANLPRYLIEELVEMVSRRYGHVAPSGVFKPTILTGRVGANAVVMGGAMLPFYSNFAPDKTVMLKGGIPDRVSF